MHLVCNRFSLTIVYCINLFDDQPSFISILYIEYLWKKKNWGLNSTSRTRELLQHPNGM